MTYNAQAYHIKCIYQTGEQNVTLALNVSMLTTAGTIANTGPPPTCSMRIVSRAGQEVSSAEIGENLVLQIDVQPSSKYHIYFRTSLQCNGSMFILCFVYNGRHDVPISYAARCCFWKSAQIKLSTFFLNLILSVYKVMRGRGFELFSLYFS